MRRRWNWALCAILSLAMLALTLCAAAQDAARPDVESLPGAAQVDLSAGPAALPSGVQREGDVVTITSGGSYCLSGALEGQLVIDADGKARVTLALDGVDISNEYGSAIYVKNAGVVTLLLPEGSESRAVSGSPAALDGSAVDEAAEGGAIHSKDDLIIEGAGALFVGGYINNGIHCSDALTVSGGKLTVEAVHNGVKGKDSVTLTGGDLKITCGGDGVVSDDAEGAVALSGGALEIVNAGDGVQAEALLDVRGGEIHIRAGGGSANAPAHEEEFPFGGGRRFNGEQGFTGKRGFGGGRGGFPGDSSDIPGDGDASDAGMRETPPSLPGNSDAAPGASSDGADSAPAPKSDGADASPAAALGDAPSDSADEALTIGGGEIEIATSYEGIEANQIAISGGKLSVKATDDGLNASGGAQSFRGRRMPGDMQADGARGEGQAESVQGEAPSLRIAGGELYVDADGDGLDSNGDISIEGGLILVDGPSRSGNGALDSGSESGGSCRVSGGTVLAIGASGMAESFDADSTQPSLRVNFDEAVPAGSKVTVTAADGAQLISHVAAKSFSCAVFSCPELRLGDEVTIAAGDQQIALTLTEVSTGAGGDGWWNR